MSNARRLAVYLGLKNAINYRKIPHAGFDDDIGTCLLNSWDEFRTMDRFLENINCGKEIKLNIHAEKVDGHSDGEAVTVSDELQHLDPYWGNTDHMKQKFIIFEEFISQIFKTGSRILCGNL